MHQVFFMISTCSKIFFLKKKKDLMQPIKQTNSTYETKKKLSYATYRTNPLVHYAKIKKISSSMFIRQHIRFLNDNFTIKFYFSHLYEYWYAHKKK